MSSLERLVIAWIVIVVMGIVYYLFRPKSGFYKKLVKKLAARR